jgi:gamma-glutamyltranspeptidase/glutathione hydrolase
MLYAAHQQHGKLPWKDLFEPAIALATQGFVVSPRMAALLANDRFLAQDPVARAYFYDRKGQPWRAGHLLRNPELAYVLGQIAERGATGFMEGSIGQAIVQKVRSHPRNPGLLGLADLQSYRAEVREPLCFRHSTPHNERRYRICGMPPPSSGALAIAQILKLIDQTGANGIPLVSGLPSAPWLHLYAEASRLAFADRDMHVGDPAFVAPPAGRWESLLSEPYIKDRAARIGTAADAKSMGVAAPGSPDGFDPLYGAMPMQLEHGTSHISVVDAFGNALAMTTSVEDGFGSRQMVNLGQGRVGGFLLNNQLTDFSFTPNDANGKPVANRVEPGKRPRSAMSPTLVFDAETGQLLMTIGSPGGAMIIHFVSKVLYGVLHWNLDIQSAINLPNFGSMNGPTLIENAGFSSEVTTYLRDRQHSPIVLPLPSGLQGIQRNARGFFGGADPRREGIVLGD